MKHSILQDTTMRLSETVLIALIVLVATGWAATQVLGTTRDGGDARKKIELRQLAASINNYYFDNDIFPTDPSNTGFCKIDSRYNGHRCLNELVRDGYVDTLPVSFDERAYWYLIYPDHIAVGSEISMNQDTSDINKCTLPSGFEFWCVKIQK